MRHIVFVALTTKRALGWRHTLSIAEGMPEFKSTCIQWTADAVMSLRGLDRRNTAVMVHPDVGPSAVADAARRLFHELSSEEELRAFAFDGSLPKR